MGQLRQYISYIKFELFNKSMEQAGINGPNSFYT